MNPDSSAADQSDTDLLRILGRIWTRKWLVFGSIVVFGLSFGLLAFLSTPVYRANVVLLPADSGKLGSLGSALGSLGSIASIAGVNLGQSGGNQAEEAMAVLRSRQFSEAFIADKKLLPVLFPNLWDPEAEVWRGGVNMQPTMAKAYKLFNKIRVIEEDKKTGLINLQIDWRNPTVAASWANELVARLNAVMRSRAISRSNDYLAFLQKELARTSEVETHTAISRLIEARINERVLATVSDEYAFRIVDRATAPDVQDPLWPNRPLLLALGVLTGLIVGIFLALTANAIAESAAGRSAAADVS